MNSEIDNFVSAYFSAYNKRRMVTRDLENAESALEQADKSLSSASVPLQKMVGPNIPRRVFAVDGGGTILVDCLDTGKPPQITIFGQDGKPLSP